LRLLASRCIREQSVAPDASSAVPVSAARTAPQLRGTRRAPASLAVVRRLTWQPAAPVAPHASRARRRTSLRPPVRPSATRHADAPGTWPARVAAAGRWRLLTWTHHTAGQTAPMINNLGSSLQAPRSGRGIRQGWNIALYQLDPECRCAMCRKRPRMPIRGPRCGMTGPVAAWTPRDLYRRRLRRRCRQVESTRTREPSRLAAAAARRRLTVVVSYGLRAQPEREPICTVDWV
jgi:hypothetical protein